jgi:hypothetical protein
LSMVVRPTRFRHSRAWAPKSDLDRQSQRRLIKARNWPVLRRGSIRKVKKNFVYITPTPVFGWIIALKVRSGAKMFGRMPVR